MAIGDETVTPGELPAIVEESRWEEHLPALVTDVRVRGGDNGEGAANFQARVLDARTRWLKESLESLSTQGVVLKGKLNSEAELEAIDTQELPIGTAYFVNFALRVWNGNEWASSGSLQGERGINLLGVWPDNLDLPLPEGNKPGDAYLWRNDIHVLVPGKTAGEFVWESLNIRGPEGKSTFQLWKEIPGNEEKTLQEFLASQRGDKGPQGDDAFETWKKIPGNENKTITEWQEAIRGERGANLQVQGTVADRNALNAKDPVDQHGWVTLDTGHLWIYIADRTDWVDVGQYKGKDGKDGTDGKSIVVKGAVDLASELPSNAAEQDAWSVRADNTVRMWIENNWVILGQFKGEDGKNGVDGRNLIVKDTVATIDDLPNPGVEQDVYSVQDENTLYIYLNSAWRKLGGFKGEKGDAGPGGLNSVQVWLNKPENQGKTEDDYWAAMKGEPGENLNVLGTVGTRADLDNLPNPPANQDGYVTRDTLRLYVWSAASSTWLDLGPFKGEDGINGQSTYELWISKGNTGSEEEFLASLHGRDGTNIVLRGVVDTVADLPANPEDQWVYAVRDENAIYGFISNAWANLGVFKGKDGENGKDGLNGKSLDIIKVLTPADADPPPINEETQGKAYVDLNKDLWVNTGTRWDNVGPVSMPGSDGAPGAGLNMVDVVPTLAELPAAGDYKQGDAILVLENHLTYFVNDEGEWSPGFDFRGEPGKDGERGEQGPEGPAVPIKGDYANLAALQAAIPAGVAGDAYYLAESNTLAIWSTSTNAWRETGEWRGQTGKTGGDGPPGPQGKPGIQGEQGSRWLTLPPGVDAPSDAFSGRVGDWAVSETFNVFYKTVDRGWVLWGRLVAGDVNSPMESEGRVVRLGNRWVPLPIGPVPNAVPGSYYAQAVNAEGDGTEWKAIEFPKGIEDLQAKDGKQYVRVFRAGTDIPEWKELDLTFDRYDLPIKVFTTSGEINPLVDQYIQINNTAAGGKQMVIADGPKAPVRGMVLTVNVTGGAGVVTFSGKGATPLVWHNGTPPSVSGSELVYVFTWNGTKWIGALGAVVP
ncbi:hypothetical protein [Pseudomonas aeruginosa]|uniref:hypothetical protein n=1 Tax=Pseudomonas aeruginosa TaxID=287 RepID=UPI001BD54797|nr:hypothetical protein [Pseudomonas aeruginosa]MBS9731092.1 hypothetical protein [Pseudomonas aeruginosa]